MDRSAGFTLIDIIVSLIIVGIMASIAGMGLTTGVKGYVFSKENAHMSQKVQLAMTRLNRELMELLDIVTPTSSSIIHEYASGNRAIAKVGDTIKIRDGSTLPDAGNGDILIDNVTSFTLSYYKADQTWVPGTDALQLLSAIKIDLVINRADSGIGDVTFSTTVHPRNTRNYGGAPPTTSPPTQSTYGCFVSDLTNAATSNRHLMGSVFLCLFILLLTGIQKGSPVNRAVLSALNRKPESDRTRSCQSGSVIIGLIATMVIFSTLGAVLLPLTSTSTFSGVGSNSAAKAYFLAESGYRYASSEYLNAANDSAKDAVLVALDNQTYDFAGNDGRFHLDIDAYWFKTTSDPNGSQYMATRVTGGLPTGLNLSKGYLRIDGTAYEYKEASVSAPNVTFKKKAGNWPALAIGTPVYNVARSKNRNQTVAQGGNLALRENNRGLNAFPLRNGQFQVNGNTYNYKKLDLANKLLRDITDPDVANMPNLSVAANSWIILEKFVNIVSTGTFAPGQGMETTRVITYATPIGWVLRAASSGDKTEETDDFNNLSQWNSSTLGSHRTTSVDGSKALDVTGASRIRRTQLYTSLITFDWSETGADLASTWDAAGKLLSYDIQTKVKVSESNYMAGLSFRVKNSSSQRYGISFLRSASNGVDGIPDSLVPIQGQLMVVLWQQTNSSTRKWLAYKALSSSDYIETDNNFFSDDMESGTGSWDSQSPWAQTTSAYYSTTTSWKGRFVGDRNRWKRKYLTLSTQDLRSVSSATLEFWHKGTATHARDSARVQIRKRDRRWSSWSTLATYTGNFTWRQESIDISNWLPKRIQIRFQTQAKKWSTTDGWWIDDVTISAQAVNWPTMVVRIEEKVASSGRFSGQKVNDIQAFIGDVSAHGTAGTNPLDNNRKANPRGSTHWPPDDVADTTSAIDYYTLVQWNSSVDSSVDRLGTGDELNSIIRSNALTTPASGSFTQDEVALHTWGGTSTSVFFDDFAIQLAASSGGAVGFLNPIQQ